MPSDLPTPISAMCVCICSVHTHIHVYISGTIAFGLESYELEEEPEDVFG